ETFSHAGPVRSVIFHPNNTMILSGSADKTAVLNTLSCVRVLAASAAPLRAVALTPNASHVLTAGDDKTVTLWNLGNAAKERAIGPVEAGINAVRVSPNNVLVAAGCADKTVRLFTFADGKQLTVLQAPAPVRGVAFSPNNVTLAAACDDKSIPTWNVLFTPGQPVPADFGKPLQTFAHAAAATDVTFAPDNISLYSTSADKT